MASYFFYRERFQVRAEDGGFAVYYDGELQGLKLSEAAAHQSARNLARRWADEDQEEAREVRRIARVFAPVRDREESAEV